MVNKDYLIIRTLPGGGKCCQCWWSTSAVRMPVLWRTVWRWADDRSSSLQLVYMHSVTYCVVTGANISLAAQQLDVWSTFFSQTQQAARTDAEMNWFSINTVKDTTVIRDGEISRIRHCRTKHCRTGYGEDCQIPIAFLLDMLRPYYSALGSISDIIMLFICY